MTAAAGRLHRVVGARVTDRLKTDRRRRDRSNYITNKYYKNPIERKKFGPIVPKTLTWHKDNRPPKRARYFKVFRPERNWLNIMENSYLRNPNARRDYRAVRFFYLVVLSHLERSLWFEPDRDRIREVEKDYYNMLCACYWSRGRLNSPKRKFIRWARSSTIEDGRTVGDESPT